MDSRETRQALAVFAVAAAAAGLGALAFFDSAAGFWGCVVVTSAALLALGSVR